MKLRRKIGLLLFSLPVCASVYGQKQFYENEQEKMAIVEQRIEWLAETLGDEEPDLNALFDRLLHYIDHPLNLNHASQADLAELTLLSDIQIGELLGHIHRTGNLISIYEVQCLPSWDRITIEQVLPFVYVTDRFLQPHLTLRQLLKAADNEIYLRWSKILETQKGYKINESTGQRPYLGSSDRLYTRYRFKSGQFVSIGFTAEKDAGEEFFKGSQKQGFDFYSGHAYVRDIGNIKHAVAGDYLLAFGQGLTMGMGPALGKSAGSLSVKRTAYNVKPYTSVGENQFLRGAAATVKINKLNITAFVSHKKIDANKLQTDTTIVQDDDMVVSSFQISGLHNTPAGISDKNALAETIAGGHIAYSRRTYQVGATFYQAQYGGALSKENAFYNQYDFNGSRNTAGGIDYAAMVKNMHFFGETSMSQNMGLATLNGVIIGLDPKVAMTVLYRYYARHYQNVYANALAEGSRPANETGLYYGIEIKPGNKWLINAYADMFASRWLRFGVNAPSKGNEMLLQLTYKPNRQTEIYARTRIRNKEYNTGLPVTGIAYTVKQAQYNYRLNLLHHVTKTLALHTRFEQVVLARAGESRSAGYLAFQDILFKPVRSPFSFNLRYAVFNTDDYSSRVYAFESDVLYYYAIPGYYYKGSRIYGNLRYQYKKWLDVWIKIGQWLYDNRTTVGSGNDEIEGNKKTEVRVQLRLQF